MQKVELKNVELWNPNRNNIYNSENILDFFLKNNVKLPNNINFFTVNSALKFKKLLGIAKAMSSTAVVPNFARSALLIIAEKPSLIYKILA
jgi:hypothetical protein